MNMCNEPNILSLSYLRNIIFMFVCSVDIYIIKKQAPIIKDLIKFIDKILIYFIAIFTLIILRLQATILKNQL